MFVVGDNKVRDHDHVTGKYKGSAHRICKINLKLTKKSFWYILFHFRCDDSHLIMQEIGKFDVKIKVIPNGLEKKHGFYK